MALKHKKTNTVPAWTQADLDAAIAAGTVPAGTTLAGFVLSTDWNDEHIVDANGIKFADNSVQTTAYTGSIDAPGLPSQVLFNKDGVIDGTDGLTYDYNTNSTAVTSASASAFAVGVNGATNPAFHVDTSAANSVTGIEVRSAAAGGSVFVQATSSGANENLRLSSKGTGSTIIDVNGGSTARIIVASGSTTATNGNYSIGYTATSTSAATRWLVTNAGASALPAGAEVHHSFWNHNNSGWGHAGNTTIALQRDMRVDGGSHSFQTAGGTIGLQAAFSVNSGAAGNNNTAANIAAIHVPSSSVVTGTGVAAASFGLFVEAQTGATNNYAAEFNGRTALGSGSPLEIYNTADQTTNYERFRQYWSGNDYYMYTENGGTGSPRNIFLGIGANRVFGIRNNPSGSQGFFNYSAATSGAANGVVYTFTFGNSSGIAAPCTVNPTFTQSGTAGYTALLINPTETSVGTGVKRLLDLQVGNVSQFSVANGGALRFKTRIITAARTLDDSDYQIFANTTSAAFTVTLPTAAGNAGLTYSIKRTVGTNTLTIATTGGQTIDGSTNYAITNNANVTVMSDGAAWWIV